MTKPLFILAAALALIGCTRDETWHQKLTLVIETPEYEVSGSGLIGKGRPASTRPHSKASIRHKPASRHG
jgi:hypothetical protein